MIHLANMGLFTIIKPRFHKSNFVDLGRFNSACDVNKRGLVGALVNEICHVDRLLMVDDHVLQKARIVGREAGDCDCGGLCGIEYSMWLARCARLNDGRLCHCRE